MSKARTKTRKTLLTLLVIGVVGALAGVGTFSAFTSTTDNTGNVFAAGTVAISDNDAGSALYNVSNAKPTTSATNCIRVTYTGSLAAGVKLYASAVPAFGNYVDLSIQEGTGATAFGNCTGFTAYNTVYSGTLKNFADTYTSYASGLATNPSGQAQWNQNDAVWYRFTVTLQDNNAAQGGSTGAHSFTWEAQNL